jgi:hypothetical protein
MAQDLARLAAGTAPMLLAFVFLRAALHKASGLGAFEGIVADYRLAPSALSGPIAKALLALEILCVPLLLWPGSSEEGALLAATLLLLYAAAMGANLIRGRSFIDCGCGGPSESLSWALVARNLALTAILIPTMLGGAGALSAAETAVAFGAAVTIWLLWLAVAQLSANHTRMTSAPRSPFSEASA